MDRSRQGAIFLGLGLTLLSVAVNDVRWMLYCLVAVILLGIIAVSASISKNRTRVRMFERVSPPKQALDIQDEFRSYMSCFEGKREATHRLSYSFKTPDGTPVDGGIWLCGCALKYIEPGSLEPVAYDAENPQRVCLKGRYDGRPTLTRSGGEESKGSLDPRIQAGYHRSS